MARAAPGRFALDSAPARCRSSNKARHADALKGVWSFLPCLSRLDDPAENRARKNALAMVRGYGVNTYLFTNFPTDATWIRLACTRDDIGAMKYANHPTWITLSHGSRLVRDGAANVESTPTAKTSTNTFSLSRARIGALRTCATSGVNRYVPLLSRTGARFTQPGELAPGAAGALRAGLGAHHQGYKALGLYLRPDAFGVARDQPDLPGAHETLTHCLRLRP